MAGHCEATGRRERVDLLAIDDFAATPVGARAAIGPLEIRGARDQRRATIMASQPEPNEWYPRIEGEPVADSILNRLATGATPADMEDRM